MSDEHATGDAVVIERTFDAPPALVWKMWTEPEHFKAWYGPAEARVAVAEMDVRVGGARRVCIEMQTPAGAAQMWFAGHYREVVEGQRLVYTDAMSDAEGNVASPAGAAAPDGHPASTEVVVELKGADGGTRMVMTHRGIPADSPGATGWAMALDKLSAYLAAPAQLDL